MSDSVDIICHMSIITGITVVATVIIDALGIIDGAIGVIVGTFAAAAAATDFERANFGGRPPEALSALTLSMY